MKNRTLFLIIESIKNPKKFFCVLYKKLFSIPSLEFLRKIKSKKIKSLYLNFWFFFSKKNSNFKKICFNVSKINKKRVFNFSIYSFSNTIAKIFDPTNKPTIKMNNTFKKKPLLFEK